ncbi:hypothetical protein GQ600_17237 [Phytophthora cactorum]|nr:hypothetical protein GQ600_17237 [Phytophthora cactorum]
MASFGVMHQSPVTPQRRNARTDLCTCSTSHCNARYRRSRAGRYLRYRIRGVGSGANRVGSSRVVQGIQHLESCRKLLEKVSKCALKNPASAVNWPPNQWFPRSRTNVLRKNIRKEQDAWRCLVLDANLLEQQQSLQLSGPIFHDIPYSEGSSTTTARTKTALPSQITTIVLRSAGGPQSKTAFLGAVVYQHRLLVRWADRGGGHFGIELSAPFGGQGLVDSTRSY